MNNIDEIKGGVCALLEASGEDNYVMVLVSGRQKYITTAIHIEGEKQNFMTLYSMNGFDLKPMKSDIARWFKRATGSEIDYAISVSDDLVPTEFYSVERDMNEEMFKNGVDLLDPSLVVSALKEVGITYSRDSFWEPNVSHTNTLDLSCAMVPEGIDDIPDELKPYLFDTTKFKTNLLDDDLRLLLDDLYRGVSTNLMIYGPQGTGKTYGALAYAEEHHYPVVFVGVFPGMDRDSFLDYKTMEDGTIKLNWCPAVYGFVGGATIILDEANLLGSELHGLLHGFLTDQLSLSDGTVVRKHPNTRIILTSNPNYRGTNPFSSAVKGRINSWYKLLETKDTFKAKFEFNFGYHNDNVLDNLWTIFTTLQNYTTEQGDETDLSYRQFNEFMKSMLDKFNQGLITDKDSFDKWFDFYYVHKIIQCVTFDSSLIGDVDFEGMQKQHRDMLRDSWFTNSVYELGNYEPNFVKSASADDIDLDELLDGGIC